MADFAAVLKKTIDAQANPDQELRQRVYAKARSTIEQKLAGANVPEAFAQRQRQMLESSIEEVETEYRAMERAAEEAAQPEPDNDPLEDFLKAVQEAGVADEQKNAADAPDFNTEPYASAQGESEGGSSARDDDFDHYPARPEANAFDDEEPKRSGSKGLIIGLIAVLLLGGAGYAGWAYQDQLKDYVSSLSGSAGDSTEGTDAGEDEETDAVPTGQEQQAPEQEAKPQEEQKLTQRLLPDGSEVDEGTASDTPKIGEGTSNAPISGAAPANGSQNTTGTTTQAETIPVGQPAFFYEEQRPGEASAPVKGNVVWSVVQDSPGEGEPDEPAIRADVSFPASKVSLRMTFRRNADQSIPASHLIEMIYTVPDDFSGGAVENVQRITFKDTEQAAGNPLAAIPMKIADNFFLVALNDARTAVDMNLSLMRRQQWVDIPVTYRNGRRALISMEKGIPGDKVFDEVLKDWSRSNTGTN